MHTIVHMEIPADDVKRAKDFYSRLFGWEIKEAGPGMEYFAVCLDTEGNTFALWMMDENAK